MSGKDVVIVTGVSSGIGRATAGLLAHEGFRVFGTLRDDAAADRSLPGIELVRLDPAQLLDRGIRKQFGLLTDQLAPSLSASAPKRARITSSEVRS